MRFTALPLLFLTGASVLALPIENAQPGSAPIEQSMRNVVASLDRLTAALRQINPRMSSQDVIRLWPNVEQNCHAVSGLLESDARNIRMSPKLAISESANLLNPIDQVEKATQRTVDGWVNIKNAINARDRKGVVATLQHHKNTAKEYADAVLSVQGTLSQGVGTFFVSRVSSDIDRAINAYNSPF